MNALLANRPASTVRIESIDQMRPLRTLTPAAAQPLSNFVVFEPTWLPAGTSLGTTTLRPEAPPGRPEGVEVAAFAQTPYSPGNPCSLRTRICGPGREVRIKQFLYDWAPSAAGIASLWEGPTAEPYRVPYGLWAHPYKRRYDRSRIVELADLPGLARARPLGPAPEDATLDSLLYLEDARLGHYEVEVIARCPEDRDPVIWMTGMSSASEQAIPWPPKPEPAWEGEVRATTRARGTTVWLAALTARFGAWEALWEEQGFRYAVWFGASQRWDRVRVLAFVERLRPLA